LLLEVLDRGFGELEAGRLNDAEAWFRRAQKHVWGSDQVLVRKLEDVIYQIQKKRVAGIYIRVTKVRLADKAEVAKDLLKEIREKLVREDFLMVKLSSTRDPKIRELKRMLTVTYREDPGRMMTLEPGKKLRSTKITCDLKLMVPGDGGELWVTSVVRETGPVDVAQGINERTLRDNASALFWRRFRTVAFPRNLLFH